MRFLAVILIAVALLGGVGVSQYALTRRVSVDITRDVDTHGAHMDATHGHSFRIEMTPTFDAGRDPFAVQLAGTTETPRLSLRGPTGVIVTHTADIARGDVIVVEDVALTGERASLFVEAVPSPAEASKPCAVRVRVLSDGALCDDVTVWSTGNGSTVAGTIDVRLTPRLESVDRGLVEEPADA